MTPQQVVGLGVRLFAVWLGLFGLSTVRAVVAARSTNGFDSSVSIVAFALVIFYWLAALLMWFFPMAIAHRLVPKTRFENALGAKPLELARVGASLLGLWLVCSAVPGLASVTLRAVALLGYGPVAGGRDLAGRVAFFDAGLRALFGIFLIVRSSWLATWLLREPE